MNKITRRLLLAAAAGLLPGLALAAAGHTAYSSYLQQVLLPPLQPKEAYDRAQKTERNVAILIQIDGLAPPAALAQLQQKLADEGALAAGSTLPAGAVTDAASAERLQAQIQAMTPAQQMAYAAQMQQQMMSSMSGGGAIGAADQATLDLLSKRQADTQQRMATDNKLAMAWAQTTQRWEAAHLALTAKQEAEAAAGQPSGCVGRTSNYRLQQRKWADQHLALATKHLAEGRQAYEQRRVFATTQVGFADQLATRVKPNSHMLVTQGYGEVRQSALLQVGALAGISEQVHMEGANWYAARHSLDPDDACGVGSGG